ncbi:hypothetical protein THTE_2754 [Thermogutta terrifontis]|uniref:Uncharacterized protein n=1 Tax=Thermogutta terrifontis TaxID=1331910 RepID=A0A286RHF4_9BACT|nr:hypothetical protein [Thermogutta terrifontis]ASV75356.1 hypothetical protein THTE_2754 [Thermogutta terrifontis]
MSENRPMRPPLFTQIDVSQATPPPAPPPAGSLAEVAMLLRQLLAIEQRQTKLLEDLVNHVQNTQRQRAIELGQWRQANPHLARKCREAAEALARVQTEFLHQLTKEVNENFDALLDGEFMFTEFVDRFGPRMAHLNSILQVLTQLSSPPPAPNSSNNNSP